MNLNINSEAIYLGSNPEVKKRQATLRFFHLHRKIAVNLYFNPEAIYLGSNPEVEKRQATLRFFHLHRKIAVNFD